MSYNPPVDPFRLSNNPRMIQNLFPDPLIIRSFPWKVFKTLCKISLINKSNFNKRVFNYPVIIFSGEEDPLTPPEHAQWFIKHIRSKDKTLRLVHRGKHELLHEEESSDLWQIIKQWMD